MLRYPNNNRKNSIKNRVTYVARAWSMGDNLHRREPITKVMSQSMPAIIHVIDIKLPNFVETRQFIEDRMTARERGRNFFFIFFDIADLF